jgi:hypothetical protein
MQACVTCVGHLCANYGRWSYLAREIILSGLRNNCDKFAYNIIILIYINIFLILE